MLLTTRDVIVLTILALTLFGTSIVWSYDVGYRMHAKDSVAQLCDPPSHNITWYSIRVVYDQRLVLVNLQNATGGDLQFTLFENTGSMRPTLGAHNVAVMLTPRSPADVQVCDIAVIEYNETHRLAHRIVAMGKDIDGLFYITKGDANLIVDPIPARYEHIKAIVVGVLG